MKLPISKIIVGDRRREDLGDIAGLAKSIERWGLLHPIVVDDQNRLVAGERRLTACQSLGWRDIDVTLLSQLTTEDLREIELEENLKRKDLTEYEKSKNMVELAALKSNKPLGGSFGAGRQKSDGRPPKEAISEAKIAEAIGVPRSTLREAKDHVEAVRKYPVLVPLPKKETIAMAKQLNSTPENERETRLQELIAESDRKVDHDYKVKAKFRDAVYNLSRLELTEENLLCWLMDMDRDDLLSQIHYVEKSLDIIEQLLAYLRKQLGRPVLLKGTK